MPCFNGLAVSIHTPDGPLPEYSIQKQFRFSRITSYIPVPPPTINPASSSSRREQSTFAISITLLTPGLSVPYSTPKPTPENPCPTPQVVGMLPGFSGHKKHSGVISSYVPLTTSPNETIAAYIYFDGRQKEEVATLLRRGEETWVNSRWVGIPESEGGGLAEREFLFREVGLERWLNGLDLEGKDAAAKIERRKRRMEKKRRNRANSLPSDDEMNASRWSKREHLEKDVLRYGADESSPLQKLSEDDELFSSDDDSDDDPTPETTGQIKIALFRVLASGEIKKGEYSPQFGAHDDDEDSMTDGQNGIQLNGDTSASGEADIDHTTSFAKPKSLDPRSISTQTVTGIDGPDKPYAVFTFLYRGEKQLQKMGILKSSKSKDSLTAPGTKRRSVQTDFANIKPLKTGGTVGFSSFRDNSGLRNGELFKSSNLSKQKQTGGRMDSDDDDDDDDDKPDEEVKLKDAEISESKRSTLSPEDAKQQGELAEGVKKIKLKRQHSFEPTLRRSLSKSATPPVADSPPTLLTSAAYDPTTDKEPWGDRGQVFDETIIGSPMKKQRASLSGQESEFRSSGSATLIGLGMALGLGSEKQGEERGFGGDLRADVQPSVITEESPREQGNVGGGTKRAIDRIDEEL